MRFASIHRGRGRTGGGVADQDNLYRVVVDRPVREVSVKARLAGLTRVASRDRIQSAGEVLLSCPSAAAETQIGGWSFETLLPPITGFWRTARCDGVLLSWPVTGEFPSGPFDVAFCHTGGPNALIILEVWIEGSEAAADGDPAPDNECAAPTRLLRPEASAPSLTSPTDGPSSERCVVSCGCPRPKSRRTTWQ